MRLLSFVRKYRGERMTAPGGLGGQCVDLANGYLLEVMHQPAIQANAVDWRHATIAGMTWIANAPLNYPTFGAIVVWGPYAAEDIDAYGHVAVCLIADPMELCTFDQNWPAGHPCELVIHDYGGILGWYALAG